MLEEGKQHSKVKKDIDLTLLLKLAKMLREGRSREEGLQFS